MAFRQQLAVWIKQACRMESSYEQWRSHGNARRKELIARNRMQSLVVDESTDIQYYLEMAERLHGKFIQMCSEKEELELCYIVGYHMIEFLCVSLKRHPAYKKISKQIKKHLKTTTKIMEVIAFRIDEIAAREFVASKFEPDFERERYYSSNEPDFEREQGNHSYSSNEASFGVTRASSPWTTFEGWRRAPGTVESDVSSENIELNQDESASGPTKLFYDEWCHRDDSIEWRAVPVFPKKPSREQRLDSNYTSFDAVLPRATTKTTRNIAMAKQRARRSPPVVEYQASFEGEESITQTASSSRTMGSTLLDVLSSTGQFLLERVPCQTDGSDDDEPRQQNIIYGWYSGKLACQPMGMRP